MRGAGNILGPQQHGYIKQIGEELYFTLLEKAISKLKGIPQPRRCELKFITGGRFIPQQYVESQDERFRLYIRLSRITTETALLEFEDELKDRFANPPPPVAELIDATRLGIVARTAGIFRIEEAPNGFILEKAGGSLPFRFFAGSVRELTEKIKKDKRK